MLKALMAYIAGYHIMSDVVYEKLKLRLKRPLFYGLKMGLLPSMRRALNVSLQAFCRSFVLIFILPRQFRIGGSIGSQIITQISIFMVTTVVSFCWEISHHLFSVCIQEGAVLLHLRTLVDAVSCLPRLVCSKHDRPTDNHLLKLLHG
ncbi:uncharacterized protein [Lolium perenne]|uniref:uncharacterized protein n=1 Tax=Lolium perenne TaxID=4522 RepID=UPI003A9A009B